MMTDIENALFSDGSAHWVASFKLDDKTLQLTLHPWDRSEFLTHASFEHTRVISVDNSYSDVQKRIFPWDIIGFDSEQIGAGRWRFCLHTDAIEYLFEADWPVIRRPGGVDEPTSHGQE